MEFAVEVEILARVRHKNLLSLRGYCAEGQERLINVYEYMPNLSLLAHLHEQHSAETPLAMFYWILILRLRLLIFGVAKLIPDGATHVTTRVKATLGYLGPEYAMVGKASESCDVLSAAIGLLKEVFSTCCPRLSDKFEEKESKRVVVSQPDKKPTPLQVSTAC
ncbi:hypothetical protein K2173_016946 [Erythroxylum novogranatense]|uniref:Serine-threonine/tyrosine-protein kinase catalytic domain-containing protein n=1 Tax=Erythroxylum novogranatense TaxID=1862640 RepID=A0AAV8U830_9ROSI|nr:hypothetical protein K2173_016946 [Erythroxylum novogranatense]